MLSTRHKLREQSGADCHDALEGDAQWLSEESFMTTAVNRQIMLVEKPAGKLTAQNFRMAEAATPEPKVGEALVRVLHISLDAANRAWMQGITYREAVEENAVMAGGAIAEVVESNAPGFTAGDVVLGDAGWQD